MNDTLGDRMKENYEKVWTLKMPMRMPTILRIDGKNFHSFTRGMKRPFDSDFRDSMINVAAHLCKKIQTVQFAYCQSDEISFLLHPYKKLDTQAWFGNEIQKIVSVSAGIASSFFSIRYGKEVVFDSRVFVLPESEVVNYFIWRQKDASRNSIQMYARSYFPHNMTKGKNTSELQDLMFDKQGFNWNDAETWTKRGFCIVKKGDKWIQDLEIPLFTQDREYIHSYLSVIEE